MTKWEYIKFKYYWQYIGRPLNYSHSFPWPKYWIDFPKRLDAGIKKRSLYIIFNGRGIKWW